MYVELVCPHTFEVMKALRVWPDETGCILRSFKKTYPYSFVDVVKRSKLLLMLNRREINQAFNR
jgi:hypothetical protein